MNHRNQAHLSRAEAAPLLCAISWHCRCIGAPTEIMESLWKPSYTQPSDWFCVTVSSPKILLVSWIINVWSKYDEKWTQSKEQNPCGTWEQQLSELPELFAVSPTGFYCKNNTSADRGSSCTSCSHWNLSRTGVWSYLEGRDGKLFGFLKYVHWKRKTSQKQHHNFSTN